MKTYFFTVWLSLGLAQVIFAQTKQQQIADIDKARQGIKNNIESFQKTIELSDSSGYNYVFKNDKELKLVTIYHKDANTDKHAEWYFLNGQMIYAEQTWADNKTGKSVDNEKFYFSGGHLIDMISNGKTIDANSKEFTHADESISAYGEKLEDGYATKQ
jgi:hypothetical protein